MKSSCQLFDKSQYFDGRFWGSFHDFSLRTISWHIVYIIKVMGYICRLMQQQNQVVQVVLPEQVSSSLRWHISKLIFMKNPSAVAIRWGITLLLGTGMYKIVEFLYIGINLLAYWSPIYFHRQLMSLFSNIPQHNTINMDWGSQNCLQKMTKKSRHE